MFDALTISGYRGFDRLEMPDLGRINLLVGKNNSGKTSVLEAMSLLASGYDPAALIRVAIQRSEMAFQEVPQGQGQAVRSDIDISHLFHGHELHSGTAFEIAAQRAGDEGQPSVTYVIRDVNPADVHPHYLATHGIMANPLAGPYIGLAIRAGDVEEAFSTIPLSKRLLRPEDLQTLNNLRRGQRATETYQIVPTYSLSQMELTAAWNNVVLTDQERLVTEALQYLEPRIERIAAVPSTVMPFFSTQGVSRGGFKVKLAGTSEPVPIGSLGDGMWRMLALAIVIIRAKDGLLLVDEIDTGLHYSVMEHLWAFIRNTSKTFNVQVFATTHSYDCVHSLAAICGREMTSADEVTIQRLEAGNPQAIRYSAEEIASAARHSIEMR